MVWTLFWDISGEKYDDHRGDIDCTISCDNRAKVFNGWRNANNLAGDRSWASMEQHMKVLRYGVVKEGRIVRKKVLYDEVEDEVIKRIGQSGNDAIIREAVRLVTQALADARAKKAEKADKKAAARKRKRDTPDSGSNTEDAAKDGDDESVPSKRQRSEDGEGEDGQSSAAGALTFGDHRARSARFTISMGQKRPWAFREFS